MSACDSRMPKYKCQKEVRALKIGKITVLDNGDAVIMPADDDYPSFQVDAEYVKKHNPKAFGYFVVYEDGYQSWSPAEVFEKGYTAIT